MAEQRAVLRLLLLLSVAVGVVGMHTLGHVSAGGHGGHGVASAAVTTHGSSSTHSAMASAAATGADGIAALVGVGRSLDPSTMCLAIVAAFGLAALVAILLLSARRTGRPGRYRHQGRSPAGRGPPGQRSFGLRLADLSVLRI